MGVPESPGYFPLGSKWTWRVATGNGDAFKMLDNSEEPLNNEPFYGFYILGQRNLVVKERIVKVKIINLMPECISRDSSHCSLPFGNEFIQHLAP